MTAYSTRKACVIKNVVMWQHLKIGFPQKWRWV